MDDTVYKEVKAIVISFLFLIVSILIVWFSKVVVSVESETLLVPLFLLPIATYLIFTGRLTGLKLGTSGLEANFGTIAKEKVLKTSEAEKIEPSVEDMQKVYKEGVSALGEHTRGLDKSKPIALIISIGKGIQYDRELLSRYIDVLSQNSKFKFVVFVSPEEIFIGFMPFWSFQKILEKRDQITEEFVDILSTGSIDEIQNYEGVLTEAVSISDSNIKALDQMTTANLEALVVIDHHKELRGIVERDVIQSKLLLAMSKK